MIKKKRNHCLKRTSSVNTISFTKMHDYNGEGQEIEFPEVPEATDMGGEAPGFIEGIIPNFKAMMARDDVGKLEIFENSFKDDPALLEEASKIRMVIQ